MSKIKTNYVEKTGSIHKVSIDGQYQIWKGILAEKKDTIDIVGIDGQCQI